MADREAEAFSVEPDSAIEIGGPEGDVMKAEASAGSCHFPRGRVGAGRVK